MLTKNLFGNSLFWGIVAALAMNVVPAVQKIRTEKQLPLDALLSITMSIGLAINTVKSLYNSSGTVYYTDDRLPGLDKSDALKVTRFVPEEEDGNF